MEASSEEDEEDVEASDSEEFDHPETVDLEANHNGEDEEIDSDEAFGESDKERFKDFIFRGSSRPNRANGQRTKRPVAGDVMSASEDDNGAPAQGSTRDTDDEDEGYGDLHDGSSVDEDSFLQNGASLSDESDEDDKEVEDDDDDISETSQADESRDATQEELGKILEQERQRVMAPISQSAKAEAEKGLAVRSQRRAFDALLNVRIRLQKALVAVNSFGTVEGDGEVGKEAFQGAEEAALKLWDTIDKARGSFLPNPTAEAGQKRKRDAVDLKSSSQAIWDSMGQVEEEAAQSRRKILDKWSTRVQRPTAGARLMATASQSLVSNLDDQLLSADRLIKRTRTPRSCAPAQAAEKVNEDPEIYDDADFYQQLLKELVDQRTTDSSAPGSSVPTVRWAAIKEAKTRKHVDRKASKGRKLRFNVHEKLQNFTAPEDRTTWEQDAVDRFCGTLFGLRMELKEEDEDEDDEAGGARLKEALQLFRS